jgi:hypothetical protein
VAPGSPEYGIFIKDILWGLHPALTTGEQATEILWFAADYVNGGADRSSMESDITSQSSVPAPNQSPTTQLVAGFNRTAVVNYAYAWATNGGTKRNPSYPDFVSWWGLGDSNDCTNFTSQAIKAGGALPAGTGSCDAEVTMAEWYVKPSSGFCLSPWAWSTGWSTVVDFYKYHTQTKSNATWSTYTKNQLSQLRTAAMPGDIVQLQNSSGGAKWHSMVLTKKSGGEIYFTYHSGPNGKDVVDKKLADIAAVNDVTYWRLKFGN